MATLSPASAAAIARLRSYVPPPTTWYSLPLTRRAAVLILLYADRKGDLRVVLTMRAATLKSYAGQAALPGGKSDSLLETPLKTARREAWEEIGLPLPSKAALDDASPIDSHSGEEDTKYSPETPNLPYPFKLEHLCQLPTNLAKTELVVRPCVAFLHATAPLDKNNKPVDTEAMLIPRLDAKEVAAVFSGPFYNFLKAKDETNEMREVDGTWYRGMWTDWHEHKWRMHNFYVPVKGQLVTRPQRSKPIEGNLPYRDRATPFHETENPDPLDKLARFRVFGMTARILVDCARVAYGEDPEFEHNSHFGDEDLIRKLLEIGRLERERGKDDEFDLGELKTLVSGNGRQTDSRGNL